MTYTKPKPMTMADMMASRKKLGIRTKSKRKMKEVENVKEDNAEKEIEE